MLPEPADLAPILADLGRSPVQTITRLHGGGSGVFRLDLEDGTNLVLKTFIADHLHPRKDAYAASLLEGSGLPVMRHLLVDESQTRLPDGHPAQCRCSQRHHRRTAGDCGGLNKRAALRRPFAVEVW
jgi:hypothetical protein